MSGQPSTPWSATDGTLGRYIWLLWVIWLLFLFYPLEALFQAHPGAGRMAVVLAAAAVFAGVYTWNIIHALRALRGGPPYTAWPALVIMAALAILLTVGDRREWVELFIFFAVSMGPSLPPKRALSVIAVLVLLSPVLGVAIGGNLVQTAQMMFQMAVSGTAVVLVARTIVLDRELRLARGEIARLAVSEERLRFARDLHDLLGHSLSLIALKSELAGKLAISSPARAAGEIRDVEVTARQALHEVREAVAGYRQPTLESELQSAGEILTASGIAYRCEGEIPALTPAQEAVLGWAVREGVTNVIKHSRAQNCLIRLSEDADGVCIEVMDDGPGTPQAGNGSGLPGLSERAAALGGRCWSGPSEGGGFRLAVSLPERGTDEQAATRDRVDAQPA